MCHVCAAQPYIIQLLSCSSLRSLCPGLLCVRREVFLCLSVTAAVRAGRSGPPQRQAELSELSEAQRSSAERATAAPTHVRHTHTHTSENEEQTDERERSTHNTYTQRRRALLFAMRVRLGMARLLGLAVVALALLAVGATADEGTTAPSASVTSDTASVELGEGAPVAVASAGAVDVASSRDVTGESACHELAVGSRLRPDSPTLTLLFHPT